MVQYTMRKNKCIAVHFLVWREWEGRGRRVEVTFKYLYDKAKRMVVNVTVVKLLLRWVGGELCGGSLN